MSKTIAHPVWLLTLTLLLAGCGSSPRSDYYLLTAEESRAPSGDTPALGIGPIEVPEYLNRASLVVNREGNKLQIASSESWAEPLDAGVKRVLALNLASLLDTQDVRYFPWHPKRAPQYGVRVNLLTLDTNNQAATLTAEWLVYKPADSLPVQQRISRLQLPLATSTLSPEHVAPAYSELLRQLSELIAGAIQADQAGADPATEN